MSDNLTLTDYQKAADRTAIYPYRGAEGPAPYPFVGLSGEAGEVSEQFKKLLRDDDGFLTADRRDAVIKELGDVLWYVAAIAHEVDADLEEVARRNIDKLTDRDDRGVIHGDGDDR